MILFINKQGQLRIFWRLLLFIALTFALNIPHGPADQGAGQGTDGEDPKELLSECLIRGYLSSSIFLLSAIVSLYAQTRFIEKVSIRKYGLYINATWLNEFMIGCSIATAQLILFYSIMYFSGSMRIESFYWIPSGVDNSFTAGLFSELFGQLVGSFGEELFFRSFLFLLFLEAFRHFMKEPLHNAILSSVIISLLFGLAHFTNEGATWLSTANLALDGMMLAVPFLLTGRIGMSLGIHFFWNLLSGAVFGAGISGNLSKVSLLRIQLNDNLFTGGAFGPEGSILIIVLDSMAVALIYWWWKNQKQQSLLSPHLANVASPNTFS